MASSSRILFQNFFTDLPIAGTIFASGGAVGQSNAQISGPQAFKVGYATMTAGGTYTDIHETLYRIEFTLGGDFGAARYRWTDNYQGASTVWNAENLFPLNGVAHTLNRGVTITFQQVGVFVPQFAIGDTWIFQVVLRYGYPKAFDGARDSEWRSGVMPANSTIEWRVDCGSAVAPTAFVWLDHNIPSDAAALSLKTKSSGFTDPPDFTMPITWHPNRIVALLTTSARRYWRICVTLGSTALTYLRWSEIFLGNSLIFDQNFNIGFQESSDWQGAINVDTLRRGPGPRLLEGVNFRMTYGHMSSVDQARLRTLRTWINDPVHEVMRPFLFVPLDIDPHTCFLMHWVNAYTKDHEFLERYSDPVEFAEVIRSVA